MQYLFLILGGLFLISIFLTIRISLVRIFSKKRFTGRKFILFYVRNKYTSGKSPGFNYNLRLISKEQKYKVNVLVNKEEYDRLQKGNDYGLLPFYYNENNEKLYVIGNKKEMSLEEALSQEMKHVVLFLLLGCCTIFALYYAYFFIL